MKKERIGIVLPIVLISYFMILLDNSVVFTSTVKISQDLQMTSRTLSWISTAYVLTFGGFQLLGGRLGDIFGRKRLFLIGTYIFTFSSLLVGLSVSAPMMIVMRAIQGAGAAILAPTTLALLMDNYQGKMLQRGINYYGMTAGLGASLGLLIGGLIASFTSWRIGFLINVPVGVGIILLTIKNVKKDQQVKSQSMDILGSLYSAIAIAAVIYSINGEKYRLFALIVSVMFLGLFIRQEGHAKIAIMPLELFKDSTRVGAYIARFFIIGMAFSFLYLAPQVMQNLYHFSPFLASIAFLLMSLPQFVAATQVGRLNTKISPARLAVLASIISIVALAWIVIVGAQNGFWLALAVPLILVGIGQGLAMSPLTSLGVAHTTADISGSASGVLNTFHQTGQSIGLALVTALTSGIHSYTGSFNAAMLVLLFYATIALLATSSIMLNKKRP